MACINSWWVQVDIWYFCYIYSLYYIRSWLLDPENLVLDTKIMSLSGLEPKRLAKIEFFVYQWQPFCFLKKIPQWCQGGTRLIFNQDSPEMMNQEKKLYKSNRTCIGPIWPFGIWTKLEYFGEGKCGKILKKENWKDSGRRWSTQAGNKAGQ